MSMPISSRNAALCAVMAVLVTGCSGQGDESASAVPEAQMDDGKLDCALSGAADFRRVCEIERVEREGQSELVFRHPNGGFRRFLLVTDGRGLVAADGAEEAKVALEGDDRIVVTLGGDRYRLPAKMKSATVATEAENDQTGAQ